MKKKFRQINIKGQIFGTVFFTLLFLFVGLFIETIINFLGSIIGMENIFKEPSINQYLSIVLAFCSLTISIFFVFKSMLEKSITNFGSSIKSNINEQIGNSIFSFLISQNSSDTTGQVWLLEQLNSYIELFKEDNNYYQRAFSIISKNSLMQLETEYNKLKTEGIDIPIIDSPLFSERLIADGKDYVLIERFNVTPSQDFTEGYYNFLKDLSQNNHIRKRFIFLPNKKELIKQFNLDLNIDLVELDNYINNNLKDIISTYESFFKEMQKLNFETYFCSYATLSLELGNGVINETIEVFNDELVNISSLPTDSTQRGTLRYRGEKMNVHLKILANSQKEKQFLITVDKYKKNVNDRKFSFNSRYIR